MSKCRGNPGALVAAGLVLASGLALPEDAAARSTGIVSYPMADVWPTAVRFLRVDRGFPVKEKDESLGYVLFDYLEGSKSYRASLELVRTSDSEGRDATLLVVTLSDLPRHYEQTLIDKLTSRVRDERGAPVAPRPRKAPEPPPAESKPAKPGPDAGTLPKDLPRR